MFCQVCYQVSQVKDQDGQGQGQELDNKKSQFTLYGTMFPYPAIRPFTPSSVNGSVSVSGSFLSETKEKHD